VNQVPAHQIVSQPQCRQGMALPSLPWIVANL
jgi:hypothetical protein